MTNQPERTVEDIVEELVDKLSRNIPSLIPTRDELDAMKKNIHREIRQELTPTLTAERQKREEVVEAQAVKIMKAVHNSLFIEKFEELEVKDGKITLTITQPNNPK